MAPEFSGRLVSPAAAGRQEQTPAPGRLVSPVTRRPDLSAPFTVAFITGLMSAGLFFLIVVRDGVPLDRVLHHVLAVPFGVVALAFLAAAGVIARIGDI